MLPDCISIGAMLTLVSSGGKHLCDHVVEMLRMGYIMPLRLHCYRSVMTL